jgi:hypothetical protein
MDIQMRRDGSGRINMEYRVSNMAEVIGRLDGNENWPIVPVGRADFERSIERIEGMRIVSFSSREGTQNTVYNITLEFNNTDALVKFLDSSGGSVSFEAGRLDIVLLDSYSQIINPELLELMQQVFSGYNLSISFSADGNSTMAVTDGAGNQMPPPETAQIVPSGRKVSLSIDMAETLSLSNGLGLSFQW